jgi:hypothetical protein
MLGNDRVLADDFAKRIDVHLKPVVANFRMPPDARYQLIFGDDIALLLNQRAQNIECGGTERNVCTIQAQSPSRHIECEPAEAIWPARRIGTQLP